MLYISYDKIKSELGEANEETLNNTKSCMKDKLETCSQWANSDVYGFRLIKVDEGDEEMEELDSCWGFYSRDPRENGIKDYLPKEFEYLLDEAEFKYSY